MKTIILYTTTHGCTKKCVNVLKDQLDDPVDVFNMKKESPADLKEYDTVIIGGSIHAGQIQRRIKTFCQKNETFLKEKKLGLFLCCMEEGETAQQQFDNAYPESLRVHATATGLFGGEFDFDKMGIVAKSIVKKVAKVEESVSKISKESISQFAQKLK